MIKILAIGNSFSQNATEMVQFFDKNLYVRNMYIAGCSLEMHCENLTGDIKAYEYMENGADMRPDKISIKDALVSEKWDYITVQQVSGFSGRIETYYPYITKLLEYVKMYSDAEIVLHETWAYENTSQHPHFEYYGHDRKTMYERIVATANEVAQKEHLRVIRAGEAVEKLRSYDMFLPEKGGLALTCDGHHLSENYGRFLAAGVWLKFFTGNLPDYLNREELSEPFKAIKSVLEEI